MSTRASAPPTSARVEIGVGTGLTVVGGLILLVHVGSIPGFVAELVIGFVSVSAFWPMVGGSLLVAAGIFAIVRGRHGLKMHRRAVARVEAMRARAEQRQQHGQGGVSAGVAGTAHRMPTGFSSQR